MEPFAISELWRSSIVPVPKPSGAESLGPGGHYSLNVGKALEALGAAIAFHIAAGQVNQGTATEEIIKLGIDGLLALAVARKALFTRLTPVQLLTCYVLSQHEGGLAPDAIRGYLQTYVDEKKAVVKLLPTYLGIDEKFMEDVLVALDEEDAVPNVLGKLEELGRVRKGDHGRFHYVEKHIDLSID
jgi:hypothetical protein